MFNDLIGDLSEIRLYALLRPLLEGKKSGVLAVKGVEETEIYLEGGGIVHARIGARIGDDALPFIMDLDNGRVTFNWRLSTEEHTITTPTEQIISDWAQREEEWQKIRRVVPSPQAVFSLVAEDDGRDRVIPGGRWAVLALCNGGRNVSEIAARLGRSVFEVSGVLRTLVEGGLLEKTQSPGILGKESRSTVDQGFFDAAETELKKVMGPIARIILNDTLAAFAESREAFPKDRVKSFISTVCDQIPEGPKREMFGKAMYVAWLSTFENS